MLGCSKDDKNADKIFKLTVHKGMSVNLDETGVAILDIMQGIHDLAVLAHGQKGFRSKSGARKQIVDRVLMSVEGLRTYLKQYTKRVDSFICCVESLGGVKHRAARIQNNEITTMCDDALKVLDKMVERLKQKDVPSEQIQQSAAHAIDMLNKTIPNVGKKSREVESWLRAEVDTIIMTTIGTSDEFVSKMAKVAVKNISDPTMDDLK